jgi:hypothetical protein
VIHNQQESGICDESRGLSERMVLDTRSHLIVNAFWDEGPDTQCGMTSDEFQRRYPKPEIQSQADSQISHKFRFPKNPMTKYPFSQIP